MSQNVNNVYNKQMTSNVIVENSYSMEYVNEHSDSAYSAEYEPSEENLMIGEEIVLDENTRGEASLEDSRLNEDDIQQEDLNEDEETIATFITAAGQQLALYAVEDSDEIFAVAVYDESGEPPTSFQFLMKSDVERLIGEGAVRTVKKPTQLKKQLVTTHSPIFVPKSCTRSSSSNDNKNISKKGSNGMKLNCNTLNNRRLVKNNDEKHSVVQDNERNYEFFEQSTVQCLLDEEQSESELTFDEVEETLRKLMKSECDFNRKIKTVRERNAKNRMILIQAEPNEKLINLSTLDDNKNSIVKNVSNDESNQENKLEDDKRELLDVLMDSPPCVDPSDYTKDISKAKRSRKQQLTSVNREDTEIIIQPATELIEEETRVVKKRRKRRGKVSKHKKMGKKIKRVRRKEIEIIEIDMEEQSKDIVEITLEDGGEKCSSDKENEVIELEDSEEDDDDDDDDDDDSQSLPDSKLTQTSLQCEHCNRNFRQRRTLENHMKVCSKSVKLKIKNSETQKQGVEGTSKKQYSCKICQEKFDVVVALARHVRTCHPQKKKLRTSQSFTDDEDDEDEDDDDDYQVEDQDDDEVTKRPRKYKIKEWRKETIGNEKLTRLGAKRMKINQAKLEFVETRNIRRRKPRLRIKRLNCNHCGKQFLSRALLNVHFLQHSTKNREIIRRCQFCRKLIKSKSLFLHHLKTHRHTNMRCIKKSLRSTKTMIKKNTIKRRGKSQKC